MGQPDRKQQTIRRTSSKPQPPKEPEPILEPDLEPEDRSREEADNQEEMPE